MAITLVGSQTAGGVNNAASIDVSTPANVTAGNAVLCVAQEYNTGTPGASAVTKVGGTSTVGTIVRDHFRAGGAGIVGIALYTVPITGGGSLTLRFTPASSTFIIFAHAEFNGIATASYLGVTDTNNGNGQAHTTNSMANVAGSLILYGAAEASTTDQTRTFSNSLIFKSDLGASTLTGIAQYKITSGTPNTLTDTFPETVDWWVAAAEYKAAGGATLSVNLAGRGGLAGVGGLAGQGGGLVA